MYGYTTGQNKLAAIFKGRTIRKTLFYRENLVYQTIKLGFLLLKT